VPGHPLNRGEIERINKELIMANHAHQLVVIHDRKAVTTSQAIAQLFGKPHNDVMKVVRRIADQCPSSFSLGNFSQSTYVNERSQVQPSYELTRDAFTLVAMSFTGERALQFKLAYIAAFNQMEAALQTQSQAKILETLDQAYDIESKLQEQVTSLKDELLDTYRTQVKLLGKPRRKVAFGHTISAPRHLTPEDKERIRSLVANGTTQAEVARQFGINRRRVYDILRENGLSPVVSKQSPLFTEGA
jgi:Rha family phage regulatory protein